MSFQPAIQVCRDERGPNPAAFANDPDLPSISLYSEK